MSNSYSRIVFCPGRFPLNPFFGGFSRRTAGWLLLLMALAAGVVPARATITVVDYWRMGEADPGAVAGGTPTSAIDSVGGKTLKYSGTASYSSDVAPSAAARTGSSLSMNFSSFAFASNSIVTAGLNNIGLEAWVKPVSTAGDPILVYNGGTGSSGWGLMINGGSYQALFGGVAFIGTAPVTLNVWTHIAFVCNNGVATLYTNGVPAGLPVTNTPATPVGNFEIGAQTVGGGSQFFTGLIDEVRFFSFSPGQFRTNDLLLNLSPAIALGTTNIYLGPSAGSNSVFLAASSNALWTVSANAAWLHPAVTSGSSCTNVIFNYDTNSSTTRTGTLTIAGQALTITQAGATYAAAAVYTNLVSSVTGGPQAVAVDGAGNVYYADTGNNAIRKWSVANNSVTTLVSSGLSFPGGVAVDGAGNVYFADTYNNAIKKWNISNGNVGNIVTTGLVLPAGLAMDRAGNVYIADSGNAAVREWVAATGTVTNLVTTGLNNPYGVAVDVAGNVYIADEGNNAIKEWIASSGAVSNLLTGLNEPRDVAVDGSGNLYVVDNNGGPNFMKKWTAASGTWANYPIMVNGPNGVCVDANQNVYVADSGDFSITEQQFGFVNTAAKTETPAAGFDNVPVVLPASANLRAPFAPFVDSAWLSITGAVSGVVGYSFTSNSASYLLGRTGHLNILGQSIAITQTASTYLFLGTTNLLIGPAGGSNSVALMAVPASKSWTNAAVASWLHLNPAFFTGSGSTNVFFSCDVNGSSLTRTGTLSIADQIVTIVQASSNYVAATLVTNIVTGLNGPAGVAVDAAGNVYFADSYNGAIKKWTLTNATVTPVISSGQVGANGVALDGAGNVYFTASEGIKEWSASNSNVTTIASYPSTPGFSVSPEALARDNSGNLYTVDDSVNKLEMWSAANSNVTVLVSSGLSSPYGVAVDAIGGNVMIADSSHNEVREWQSLSGSLFSLVTGLHSPHAVALDGSGNVYIADQLNSALKEWVAVSSNVVTLASSSSGVAGPNGVAVDLAGNVYLSDMGKNVIFEMPYAFVVANPITESGTAGNDSLPAVLPATANLQGVFAPVSDSPWLTITGVTNGAVYFSFTANTPVYSQPRTGHIILLGRSIAVTQGQLPYQLVDTTNILVGPPASAGSVSVEVAPPTAAWAATANSSWLHLTAANQNGNGCTNVLFSYDANTAAATRVGTLTVAGETVTVTQAGSNYVTARQFATLASGQSSVAGVAVDGSGNVFFANTTSNAINEWVMASNSLANVVSTNLNGPEGLALDGAGNIYISDTGNSSLKKWLTASSSLVTITTVSSGFRGLSLDAAGNIYVADNFFGTVREWQAANSNLVTLVTGLSSPDAVVSDIGGNRLYIDDSGNQAIKVWLAESGAVNTLVTAGMHNPFGVAVDGSGNIFIGNTSSSIITESNAATGTLTNLLTSSAGISQPEGVAVDATGNLYIADTLNHAVKELTYAFVSTAAVRESAGAGNDALSAVLPAGENLLPPFAPVSDTNWLAITGVTNGVVGIAFTANTNTTARTGHIIVLGQSVPVVQLQPILATPPTLGNAQINGSGNFQFTFTNNASATFTVWSSTNLALPLTNWTAVGAATNLGAGLFQFSVPLSATNGASFFRVSSP